jgi:hypothetical protein
LLKAATPHDDSEPGFCQRWISTYLLLIGSSGCDLLLLSSL